MKKAYRICKVINCNALTYSTYCSKHSHLKQEETKKRFSSLRSSDEARQIYQSAAWHRLSAYHRSIEPLCRTCNSEGRIRTGTLVHHNPPLEELLTKGLSPFDEQYLETLCHPCHQKELYLKKVGKYNEK